MKVITPSAVPAEPATSPLFTGEVSRQPILTPEMSPHFKPTVCSDIIPLPASLCGYNSEQIAQRVAH